MRFSLVARSSPRLLVTLDSYDSRFVGVYMPRPPPTRDPNRKSRKVRRKHALRARAADAVASEGAVSDGEEWQDAQEEVATKLDKLDLDQVD